jgi:two-component system, LuxR family, response regulator FixJ
VPVIFVIEDNVSVRDATRMLLSAIGYSVRAFADAGECLAAIAADAPACVISDLQMPGMDGAELIEELARRSAPVPVIVITGLGPGSPLLARAQGGGASAVLFKPVRGEQLVAAVRRVVAG